MPTPRRARTCLILCCLGAVLPARGAAQWTPDSVRASARSAPEARNGQHDFDFEIGTWTTQLRRRLRPLTGSTTWAEYTGTTVVRPVWDGRANLVELVAGGPAGHFEALSLRLYNPETRQWSLNFSNSAGGTMTEPMFGEFRNGRGEFFGKDDLNGRAILVRFIMTKVNERSWRFEQSFSDDAGQTWEVNWIAVDTRVRGPAR
jgi:hypothetical protein